MWRRFSQCLWAFYSKLIKQARSSKDPVPVFTGPTFSTICNFRVIFLNYLGHPSSAIQHWQECGIHVKSWWKMRMIDLIFCIAGIPKLLQHLSFNSCMVHTKKCMDLFYVHIIHVLIDKSVRHSLVKLCQECLPC